MKREFEEIRVRIYEDVDPGLKAKAEKLVAKMRYAEGKPGIPKFSLNDLVLAALRYTVKQDAAKRRTPKEPR
jgi:hypothetical protein